MCLDEDQRRWTSLVRGWTAQVVVCVCRPSNPVDFSSGLKKRINMGHVRSRRQLAQGQLSLEIPARLLPATNQYVAGAHAYFRLGSRLR